MSAAVTACAPARTDGFAASLLAWFDVHGRKDLPWQRDANPYRVWVSEIMLQQTQVSTVIPYFERFVGRYADVRALAGADPDEVLHLWAGLGYYARARNLHHCARLVCDRHGGRFPDRLEELLALPGIGRSTAGAILALAMDQRHPILDGNVKRVLARFHAVDGWPGQTGVQRLLWRLAEESTPPARVRDYTQAIMDLGATLCTRARPACARCPVASGCAAHAAGRAAAYPAPRPRAPRRERRIRVLLISNPSGDILLRRRPPAGIWGGLWGLPEVPEAATSPASIRDWCRETLGLSIGTPSPLPPLRHELTHFSLVLLPLKASARASSGVMEGPDTVWYNDALSGAYGMATPIRRLIGVRNDPQEEAR